MIYDRQEQILCSEPPGHGCCWSGVEVFCEGCGEYVCTDCHCAFCDDTDCEHNPNYMEEEDD